MALSQAAVDDKNKTAQNNTARYPSSGELFAVIGIIVVFALTPLYAHQHLTRLLETIRNFVNNHTCKDDADKVVQLIHEAINANPFGSRGTARGVMALTII
jgi:hypothetical protein